jgi:hypothetical protein
VNAIMSFRIPYNARNFLTSWEPISDSRSSLLHGVSK